MEFLLRYSLLLRQRMEFAEEHMRLERDQRIEFQVEGFEILLDDLPVEIIQIDEADFADGIPHVFHHFRGARLQETEIQ